MPRIEFYHLVLVITAAGGYLVYRHLSGNIVHCAGCTPVGPRPAAGPGKSENVLTDAQGLTLYYHTTDTPTSVCSGACATAWPPLFLPSGTPGGSVSLPGTLGVQTNVNGKQVTYNGHLLYRWKSDTSAGQATGEGINNFHVVSPTIAGM